MFKQYHWKVRWSCTTPFEERSHFSGSDEQNQKFEIQISSQCPVLGTIKQTGTMHTPYSLTAITSSLNNLYSELPTINSNATSQSKQSAIAQKAISKKKNGNRFLLSSSLEKVSYFVLRTMYSTVNTDSSKHFRWYTVYTDLRLYDKREQQSVVVLMGHKPFLDFPSEGIYSKI